jgi:hypothetical protein
MFWVIQGQWSTLVILKLTCVKHQLVIHHWKVLSVKFQMNCLAQLGPELQQFLQAELYQKISFLFSFEFLLQKKKLQDIEC